MCLVRTDSGWKPFRLMGHLEFAEPRAGIDAATAINLLNYFWTWIELNDTTTLKR